MEGASQKKRVLHLTAEVDNTYMCPVKTCLHDAYKSIRGLRKHIESIHAWYYYFEEKPRLHRQEAVQLQKVRLKSYTHKMPSFSINEGIGCDFHEWLQTSCGGGKSSAEATQQARRGMKFLMYALGEPSGDVTLTNQFIDCCLGTPSVITNFLQAMEEKWELSCSGALNYLRSVSDLMDFRKSSGVSDHTLRCFAVTEVYLRRGIGNISRRKKINYSRNLDLEQLIARNSWATMEEMEKVVPYHTPRFQGIVQSIRESGSASVSDIAFATRFIITFLFLRVKCTRPMSYKYLTLTQYDIAKNNGGYVDQTTFKTAATYGFDTIILTDDCLSILDTYIKVVRPLTHPSCEYIILTANGKQYTALGTGMSLLVYQAIGKLVHPSRYRQIVETESAGRLCAEDRDVITKDQRHTSGVAKRVYQKKLSRTVAEDGRTCFQKLCGTAREEHNSIIVKGLIEKGSKHTNPESEPAIEPDAVVTIDDHRNSVMIIDEQSQEEPPPSIIMDDDDKEEESRMAMEDVVVIHDNDNAIIDESTKEETMDEEENVSQQSEGCSQVETDTSVDVTTTSAAPLSSTTFPTCNYSQPICVTSVNTLVNEVISTTVSSHAISTSAVIVPSTNVPGTDTTESTPSTSSTASDIDSISKIILDDIADLEIKAEEAERQVSDNPKLVRFTTKEDKFLTEGTQIYGFSSWAKILKDPKFEFHPCRNRDSLRVRAETMGLTKRKKSKQRKCKTNADNTS